MSKHTYSEDIVEKAAYAIWETQYSDPADAKDDWDRYAPETEKDEYREQANAVLQALWDASVLESLEETEGYPEDARVVTEKGAFMAPWSLDREDLPARLVYWGRDRDD